MVYYFNDKATKVLVRTQHDEQIWLEPQQGTVVTLKLDAEDIPFVRVYENEVYVGSISIDDADSIDRDPLF